MLDWMGIRLLMLSMMLGAAPGLAAAAEMSGSGSATYVPSFTETVELPNGDTLVRAHFRGIVLTDDPSSSFNAASQDCSTSTVIPSKGDATVMNAICDGIDRDGNVWWIGIHEDPNGGTWAFVDGTGPYQGIDGGGTVDVQVRWPDGRFTVKWQGTWTQQ